MLRSLIVALGPNGEIGHDGRLPWPVLPPDMRWFQTHTDGKAIIMGRRTYESLPARPLHGRRNLVLTADLDWHASNIFMPDGPNVLYGAPADPTLVGRAFDLCAANDYTEAVAVGGATIYRAALPFVTRIYLTRLHRPDGTFPAADTFFPWDAAPEAAWRARTIGTGFVADGYCGSFSLLERPTS